MSDKATHDEYLKLYDAAIRFKAIEAWQWMNDDMLFAVHEPQNNELGYCTVIGALGEVLGLIVYMGQPGFESFKMVRKSMSKNKLTDEEVHWAWNLQDCISLTFEDRKYLSKEDINVIKELGLKFRGRNAYPLFRRLKPYYMPWFLTRQECIFMTTAIEQAIEVCLMAKNNEHLLSKPLREGYCLTRYFDNGIWKERLQSLDVPTEGRKISVSVNELKLTSIKKNSVRTNTKWEIDFFADYNMPIKGDKNPYYPIVTLIADHSTGHIFNAHLSEYNNCFQAIADNFLAFMEKISVIPKEILVEKDEMILTFKPATDMLGIKLTKVGKCRMVEKAKKSLREFEKKRFRGDRRF